MSDEPEAADPDPAAAGSAGPGQPTEASSARVSPAPALSDALEPPPEGSIAEAYHRRARLAEDRLAEVLAAYRKLKAENESHRERVTKNLERRFEQRIEKLLVEFIDILDNFDRALEATERTYAGNPLIEGLILVRTQLLQTLRDQGLERIPAIGLPFDPSHSEAVQTQPVAEPEHHHLVVKELLRGYRVHGHVVRPSHVVVGEYSAETPPATAAKPASAPAPEELSPPELGEQGALEGTDPRPAAAGGGESLEDIINRAEAQEALFPEAFDEEEK